MSVNIVAFVQTLRPLQAHPTLGGAVRLGLKLLSHVSNTSFSSAPDGGETAAEVIERLRAMSADAKTKGLTETIESLSACTVRVRQFSAQNESGVVTLWVAIPTDTIVGVVARDIDCEQDPAVIAERDPHVSDVAQAELKRINARANGELTFVSARRLGHGGWLLSTSRPWREISSGMVFSGIIVGGWRGVLYAPADDVGGDIVSTQTLIDLSDIRSVIPLSKGDFYRANAVVALGYPAVAPILGDLLRWLRDTNWPIAIVIGQFLATVGAPLAPHIRAVLDGDDDAWKIWVISDVIRENAELFEMFKGDLERLATNPTAQERLEELDEFAREALAAGPSPPSGEDPRYCYRQPFAQWRRELTGH